MHIDLTNSVSSLIMQKNKHIFGLVKRNNNFKNISSTPPLDLECQYSRLKRTWGTGRLGLALFCLFEWLFATVVVLLLIILIALLLVAALDAQPLPGVI